MKKHTLELKNDDGNIFTFEYNWKIWLISSLIFLFNAIVMLSKSNNLWHTNPDVFIWGIGVIVSLFHTTTRKRLIIEFDKKTISLYSKTLFGSDNWTKPFNCFSEIKIQPILIQIRSSYNTSLSLVEKSSEIISLNAPKEKIDYLANKLTTDTGIVLAKK